MTSSPNEKSSHEGRAILDDIRKLVTALASSVMEDGEAQQRHARDLTSLQHAVDELSGVVASQAMRVGTYVEQLRVLEEALTIDAPGAEPVSSRCVSRIVALARLRSAEAQLSFRLARRGDERGAMIDAVRSLVAAKHPLQARSLAFHLASSPATRDAGLLGAAVVASKGRLGDLAASYLRRVPDEISLRYAPSEWYSAQFDMDPNFALDQFHRNIPSSHPSETWSLVIRRAIVFGLENRARSLCRKFLKDTDLSSVARKRDLETIRFIDGFYSSKRTSAHSTAASGERSGVTIGIWDTAQPDVDGPSADLGSYLESVVLLSRLSRWAQLESADDDLGQGLGGLTTDVDGRHDPENTVRIVALPRFMPSPTELSSPTWAVFHGGFGEKVFGAVPRFPSASKIRPLFFGFELHDLSCDDPGMLVAMQKYGPVGCRDWTSTFALLSHGVDAFYSGALASAASPSPDCTHMQWRDSVDSDLSGLIVSSQDSGGSLRANQKSARLRAAPLDGKLRTAIHYIEALMSAPAIVTPHLETTLIARALSLNVEYTPPKHENRDLPSQSATAGGQEFSPVDPVALLDSSLKMISEGRNDSAVYQAWAQQSAGAVAYAKQQFHRPLVRPKPEFDVASLSEELRLNTVRMGPAHLLDDEGTVNLAMACDSNLFGQLAVAIESIRRATTRSLRIHLLARGLSQDSFDFLSALYPSVVFDFIPCDSVDYGNVLSMAGHLTVSAIDRLLLPSVLNAVPKVVYLDVDLMVLDDVGKLFDIDLKSVPLAACSATADWSKSGYGHLLAVAHRMEPSRATELKHRMLRDNRKDFVAFNSGVLVLNLEQMRSDDFCVGFLGYLSCFDMNDQDVLYSYAGGNRRELEPGWNCIPSHVYADNPRIVHWAGPAKPWHSLRMPYQNTWMNLVEEVAANAASCGLDASPIAALVTDSA